MGKKKKYYVVWQGNQPGVYDSWTACQLQIKGYPNAKYKSFSSRAEAEAALTQGYSSFLQKKDGTKKATRPRVSSANIIKDSIAVDAACSGNPGVMEYQGVHTHTGEQFFHKKFRLGTNNIGEFLALVHALAWLKQQGKHDMPIYSDSAIAIKWVAQKKCKTKLKHAPSTEQLHQVIGRAEKWLQNNTYKNPLIKWETASWGEIPADFGRK